MIVDIRTVPEGHSALSQEVDGSAFHDDLPGLCGTIACNAGIDRSGPLLYVHLRFTCRYEFECSRCLEPFDFPIVGDLRLTIGEGGAKAEEEGDTADFLYDNGNPTVDLGKAIYEEIMIAFPLKPLCRESCRGVLAGSPSGGSGTVVKKEEIDPRWEALKKLKKST